MHLFLNISVKELPNFMRKYYLTAELLIFKHRQQNISVSSTALLTTVTRPKVTLCCENLFDVRSCNWWWCQLLWALWGVQTCSLLIKVQRWMASIIQMSCFINSFRQPFATCLATYLLFNRTTLLPTGHTRPCSYQLVKQQTSPLQLCGQPTVLTWTR